MVFTGVSATVVSGHVYDYIDDRIDFKNDDDDTGNILTGYS